MEELQEDNLRLREALEHMVEGNVPEYDINNYKKLLSTTNMQSLADHDNEVVDRCKNIVADDALAITFQSMGAYRSAIIKQIGELKAEHD